MTKQSGLGDAFWVGGNDISGDVQTVKVASPIAVLDSTDITQSANSRLFGHRDGTMDLTVFMDPTTAHPVLSALPTADTLMTYARGTGIGNPAACLEAKQINYDPTRATDGSILITVQGQGDGFGLEWGVQLTSGLRTDTAATNGTSLDQGAGFSTPSVPASLTPVTNTSPLPATVVVSGGTGTNVSINGVLQGTFDGTYTVPAGGTIALTYSVAPTWTWTLQSAFGAQAYLQVTAFTGTDVTVHVQDSADNSTFADVTGLVFTATTAAQTWQRLATANTATLRRYVRVTTTTSGGFTSATFAVVLNRNPVASVVF